MNSTHPDFAGIDIAALSDAAALRVLNANLNEPVKVLNGEVIELDSNENITIALMTREKRVALAKQSAKEKKSAKNSKKGKGRKIGSSLTSH